MVRQKSVLELIKAISKVDHILLHHFAKECAAISIVIEHHEVLVGVERILAEILFAGDSQDELLELARKVVLDDCIVGLVNSNALHYGYIYDGQTSANGDFLDLLPNGL